MEVVMQSEKDTELTLSWGRWTFTAQAMMTVDPPNDGESASDVYAIAIEIHGDSDGGIDGVYGEIGTCWQHSLDAAVREAKRMSRLTVTSLHSEPTDADWEEHERAIDLGPIIERAAERLRLAIAKARP